MRSLRTHLPLALATALATALAAAPAAAAPSAAEKETARSLLREADQLTRQKNDVRALAAYRAADEIMKVPTTGIEVARCLERMGQLIEARDKYLAVKTGAKSPDEPAVMDTARRAAEDAERALLPRIPTIQIHGTGVDDPSTIRVSVDDVALPALAAVLPRRVNPGDHVLVVGAPGYRDERVEVSVIEGQQRHVNVALVRGASTTATPIGACPPVVAAEARRPDTGPPRGRSPLAYVALTTGALGVGVGAITGVMALSRASAAEDNCTGTICTPAAQADIDVSKTFGVISTVAFGVGVVGLAVGAFMFFSSKPQVSASRSWGVATGPGAVGLGGQF